MYGDWWYPGVNRLLLDAVLFLLRRITATDADYHEAQNRIAVLVQEALEEDAAIAETVRKTT